MDGVRLCTGPPRRSQRISDIRRKSKTSVSPKKRELRIHDPARQAKTHSKLALEIDDNDSVVVVTLDCVPFCCPGELRTMSHANLIKVASTLNERLPQAFSIKTASPVSAGSIRRQIAKTLGVTRYLGRPFSPSNNTLSGSASGGASSPGCCLANTPLSRMRLRPNSPRGGHVKLEERRSARFTGLESLPELAEPADMSSKNVNQSFSDIIATSTPVTVAKLSSKLLSQEDNVMACGESPRDTVLHPDTPTPVPRFLKNRSSRLKRLKLPDRLVDRTLIKEESINTL